MQYRIAIPVSLQRHYEADRFASNSNVFGLGISWPKLFRLPGQDELRTKTISVTLLADLLKS